MNEGPAQIPLVDLKAQFTTIEDEIREAMDRVLASQHFVLGPEVVAAEREVAAYAGARYGIGVSSGTDALLASLMALDVGPGDEVVTTAFSFFATAEAIARLGAKPVFVDIDPGTYNIAPAQIEAALTDRTRAVIPVHLYGQCADMDPILDLAERRGVALIEDAAQAFGAEDKSRRAGAMGRMGCFSFYPSKVLGAYGDGGMILTDDEALAEKLRILRVHGAEPKNYNRLIGGNFRLDAFQGAVVCAKLKFLDEWIAARQRNAALYDEAFRAAGLREDLITPPEIRQNRHVFYAYVIRTIARDELVSHLREQGIGANIYFPVPLHLQECFADLGYEPGSLPVAEQAARETLALPMYPELTEAQIARVVESVATFLRRAT
jgi:dTDP-4-amino-4,6-dideoxygalactose transaminase